MIRKSLNAFKHLSIGPELPLGIGLATMASSPDGNGVILFGGESSTTLYVDTILELKSDGQGWVGAWTTQSRTLQYVRRSNVVIPVYMNHCGLNGLASATTGNST